MLTPVFSRAREVTRHISGSARGGLRSGVAVAFDSTSTMLDQPLNSDALRRRGSSSKFRPHRRPHSNDRQTFLGSGTHPPSHSPTPCPFAVGPGRAHTPQDGACAHVGADGRAAAQREREGYPIKTRACRATTLFSVSVGPPTDAPTVPTATGQRE